MIIAVRQLLTDILPAQRQEILSRMEEDTATRYHSAVNPVKGFSLAAGRDLLRRLGASMLKKYPDAVRIWHETNGKPYLKVLSSGRFVRTKYHVSISHSDGGLLAVMSKHNTACDIQGMRYFPLEAVRGFFSPYDFRLINGAAESNSELIRLWCRRECLIKLFGAKFPVSKISLGNKTELLKRFDVMIYEAQWKHLYLALAQVKENDSYCGYSVPNVKWVNV